MSCPDEMDVVNIASARGDEELQPLLLRKILVGACTGASMPMTKIVSLVKKETSNGGAYYCFNTVDLDGFVNDKTQCAPTIFVTTIKQDLAQRKGDFEIRGEGPFAVRARCWEGGEVLLLKRDGVWWRTASIIPDEVPEVKFTWSGIDQAVRAGCRGDDLR
ncbi:hypothetical protein [Roseateles sp. BYS96W]|uniref:Uncharacterized protein n=1 Tax=Pelomonas nitida TaxID=3299027 RepID=A0ABW7GBC7_9BURK